MPYLTNKIPYHLFGKHNTPNCLFIHGNGFPPLSYEPLLKELSVKMKVHAMMQRPFWNTNLNPDSIKNWNVFTDDILKFIKQNDLKNTIGIGHSMGAVLLLLIEISKPGTFKKLFLLDPIITSILKSILYKFLFQINLIDKFHPMIKATNRKRMTFKNKNVMYENYRSKNVFSKINDSNLMKYIESIIEQKNNCVKIQISKSWENSIYRTGSMHDKKIWDNINQISCNPYVIIPKERQFGHFNYGAKLKEKNKKIKNFYINDSSHLFPIEKPNETAQIILSNL